ncbi:hypothetical protein [Kaistella jeonii]|uniref:Uncharacterized protein n=1 Tax=Kaistella jeonii TaxID=266749 RepID=A0A0C1EMH1_9FLAO|nr:hypothetical protein [Kaistella jeonii]KIA82307.1 hypothetical protein OA86_15075 [Kaistella jeonii]SFC44753.1 hypothetical protein SAMN05421876_1271 [Kaistella jeonii]VEI96523.1 Uncharacterised protein [Kaistella jeonii]
MRLTSDLLQINRQKLLNAFPIDLKQDVEIVTAFLIDKNLDIHPTVEEEIILDGQKLIIPGRVYFDNPNETAANSLTINQQTILNCIYLRHHNGFVRQQNLEKLVHNIKDYYVIPFIFQLLGEYVMEILEVADKHINEKTINNYLKFFRENPKYRQRTESRMISYWDVYYRLTKYINLKEYIGWQIFDRIKKSERTTRYFY